jgi:hypothetical protein
MLLCLVVAQAIYCRQVVSSAIDILLHEDPCEIRPVDAAFARRIRVAYHMSPAVCPTVAEVEQ